MSNAATLAIASLEVAVTLGREHPDLTAYRIAAAVHDLARLGRQLHRRYEASCSYEWACTDRYERQTERLEAKVSERAKAVGIAVELQRDPRGWPLILRIAGQEHRLGG